MTGLFIGGVEPAHLGAIDKLYVGSELVWPTAVAGARYQVITGIGLTNFDSLIPIPAGATRMGVCAVHCGGSTLSNYSGGCGAGGFFWVNIDVTPTYQYRVRQQDGVLIFETDEGLGGATWAAIASCDAGKAGDTTSAGGDGGVAMIEGSGANITSYVCLGGNGGGGTVLSGGRAGGGGGAGAYSGTANQGAKGGNGSDTSPTAGASSQPGGGSGGGGRSDTGVGGTGGDVGVFGQNSNTLAGGAANGTDGLDGSIPLAPYESYVGGGGRGGKTNGIYNAGLFAVRFFCEDYPAYVHPVTIESNPAP